MMLCFNSYLLYPILCNYVTTSSSWKITPNITMVFVSLRVFWMLTGLNQLSNFIEPVVENALDSETQTRTLNILKMNLYIFSQIVGCIHDRKSMEANSAVSEKVSLFTLL